MTRQELIVDLKRNHWSYLLSLPAAFYVFVFNYMTLPYMVIAFKRFNYRLGIFGSPNAGFHNFKMFFWSNKWISVTANTLGLNFLFISTGLLAAWGQNIHPRY